MIYSNEDIQSFNIDDLISGHIQSGTVEDLLIIVPTNRKLRQMKKLIIDNIPGNIISKINIETLTTFSTSILKQEEKFSQLNDYSAAVLLNQCAQEIKFEYFTNYAAGLPSGTLDRIKNVISDYKKHDISPETLRIESSNLERSEKLKATDIANLYEAYLNKCRGIKAFELGDIYKGVNNLTNPEFKDAFTHLYGKINNVLVYGFDEFTALEIKILEAIGNLNGISIFIVFDYYKYNPLIFSHLDKCASLLDFCGFNQVDDVTPSSNKPFVNIIRENLFKHDVTLSEKFNDRIIKIEADSRADEIELIAGEIKQLLLANSTVPSKICVAANLINNYSTAVKDKFTEYGIPVNVTDRETVDTSSVVASVISLLEILESGYYYKDVLKAVYNGYLGINKEDVESLRYTITYLNLVNGYGRWSDKIKSEISLLTNRDDEQYKLDKLKKGEKLLKYINKLLKPFAGDYKPKEFYDKLLTLVKELKIGKSVLTTDKENLEEQIRAFATFVKMADEVTSLLEYTIPGKNEKLSYYLDALRTASARTRYNVKEKSEYGVIVTAVNEIRGLEFDYLFIIGMTEGDFPTRFAPEIFFSGSFRKGEMQHQVKERYHFYQSLGSWKKGLYLTVPVYNDGKELVESGFVKDFEQLFKVTYSEKNNEIKNIYSREDLLINIGAHFDTNDTLKEQGSFELFSKMEADKVRLLEKISLYNGFVADDSKPGYVEILEELKKNKDKQYSITRLETYAKCPFKYFVESILNIEAIEDVEEELELRELGSILHNILYDFFTELRNKGVVLKSCTDEVFNNSIDLSFDIAKNHAERLEENPLSFYESEKIFGIGGKRENSILYSVVKGERESETSLLPTFFEVSFGYTKGDDKDVELGSVAPVEVNGVKMRGKIDRVDIDEDTGRYAVVDYKTSGRKPTEDDFWNGLSLQLPIYLFAVGELLKQRDKILSPEEMTIYSLKPKETGSRRKVIKPRKKSIPIDEYYNEMVNVAGEAVSDYVNSISMGKFNLSELENREAKICGYCNFRKVCRIDEVHD